VCDDEARIVRALEVILREAGYAPSSSGTLAEASELAAREPPDGAIIDLLLPDGCGIKLCERLRSWSTMPIVIISASGEEEQKVNALRAGADDYVTKPFSARELLARLDALFRRATPSGEQASVCVGDLEINLAAHRVLRDGREVRLTPTEFDLLSVLARNRGRAMSSRALLTAVWGSSHDQDVPLLRTHVANLRHKIEGSGASEWLYIKTEPGVGYRFGG
jgi:two-component system KDP operon response regulator KdpE